MRVAIALGSSLGDRSAHLELAVLRLSRRGMRFLRGSSVVLTPPMRGGTARGWFLNAVALFETALTPGEVLDRCRELEALAGRRRARFWGDRTLDLDVLLCDDRLSDDPELRLPHPAVAERPFFLGPLLEVWRDAIDPRDGRPLRDATPRGARPARVGRLGGPNLRR